MIVALSFNLPHHLNARRLLVADFLIVTIFLTSWSSFLLSPMLLLGLFLSGLIHVFSPVRPYSAGSATIA